MKFIIEHFHDSDSWSLTLPSGNVHSCCSSLLEVFDLIKNYKPESIHLPKKIKTEDDNSLSDWTDIILQNKRVGR